MKTNIIPLGQSPSYAVVLPGVILAFDASNDPEFRLSALVSANPGMPVTFLCTRFDSAVFSQAETTNRTFVFSTADVSQADVPAGYPISWLSPGDLIPDLPGDVSVTAAGSGFLVEQEATGTRLYYSTSASDIEKFSKDPSIIIVR